MTARAVVLFSRGRAMQLHVSQADILSGLRDLGLGEGDTVLTHSSLKSFGNVEGGADAVIDALVECVGPRGCVVVPTLTLGSSESPVRFDVANSPSTSGLVTETLRKRPEARRSLHPTSSAAAIGWAADELTRHHLDTPCGLVSPYGQVYLRGGWCLFMGATWGSNTMFHVAEEIAGLEYLRYATFPDARLIDETGVERVVTFRRYNCYQTGVKRDLVAMGPRFEAAGAARRGRIGPSECMLIRARDVIDISLKALADELDSIVTYETT